MGGSSSPTRVIKKEVDKIKEDIKNKPAESATKFVANPFGEIASRTFTAATGKKADALFNPVGTALGNVAEKYVDDPKLQAKEFKAQQAKAAAEQQASINEFNRNKAQSDAEAAASDKLISDISAQKRRKAKAGREATILSQKLGESDATGRKSLLGL